MKITMSESSRRFGVALAVAFGAPLSGAGCNLLNDITSPSSPTTPTTTNATETFAGSLAVQGTSRFTFTVAATGTVTATLATLLPNVAVGMGIGTPSGTTGCTLTSSNSSALAGSTPQITVRQPAGSYCVSVYDVGNLTAAAAFSVVVVHP